MKNQFTAAVLILTAAPPTIVTAAPSVQLPTPVSRVTPTGEYVLPDFGDTSNPATLQDLVNKACELIIAKGGGILIVPPAVTNPAPIANLSQNVRVHGQGSPSVTIIDRRDGYQRVLMPPIGRWSTSGWNGTTTRRELNFDGPGLSSWGNMQPVSIENRIVHGTSSYHHPTMDAAPVGKDARIYVYTVRGLFVGQYLNYYLGPYFSSGFEPIVVKSLGWDNAVKKHFFTADLGKAHEAASYLSNKNMVGSVTIDSSSNADNQTAGELSVVRKQYANGDAFLFSSTYVYQGDVLTQQGDEGGVLYNAEPESDVNAFRSKVQSVDWTQDAIVFEPGNSNVEKLASSRSLINMNEKKWVTSGTVRIVGQDDWGGIMSLDPQFDTVGAVKNGVDLKTFRFTRPVAPGEDVSKLPYGALFKGKTTIPTFLTWDGHPIKSFKFPYQGKAYPSLHSNYRNMLGGRIIASADCGWTKDIVGRYFAVNDDREVLYPGDPTQGGTPVGTADHRVYRWYPIMDFWKNADGTCGIRLGRVRMFAAGAGAPNLYDEGNYTKDGHEVPLRYIIAPGSMVYDVGQGYKDSYGGVTSAADSRTIKIVPCSDRGTGHDFEAGDPVEESIGADPMLPTPIRVRLWNEVPNNFGDYSSAIDLINYGRVSMGAGLYLRGGVTAVEELSQRKDKRAPFTTGVNIQSLTQNGVVFGADVTNAALLFNQPHNRAQAIKWEHENGTTALTVDPLSGNMSIRGSKLSVPGIMSAKGLSATETAANNLRGIDVIVGKGATTFMVKFPAKENDAKFSLNVQPNWMTQDAVVSKTTNGFLVMFSKPAPANAKLDWQLIR